jgi:prepilin-type N-terminal cleavage/methylation domain-containing protein
VNRSNDSRRGFTLIEVMVAVAVLAVAALGTLGLIFVLTRSNEHVGGQSDALALATQIISEIQNAPFLAGAGNQDPGLTVIGPQSEAVAGSMIRTVGRFNPGSMTPVPDAQAAFYNVRYEVIAWNDPSTGLPGGVEVLVTVDNDLSAQREAAGANRVQERTIPQRLLSPVQLVVRRELAGSPAVANGSIADLRW